MSELERQMQVQVLCNAMAGQYELPMRVPALMHGRFYQVDGGII
jgi:hypothetical protein